MKKIFSILSLLIVFSGFSQEYSGGIAVPTGFKIAANAPVDDRFVVADSLSLYDLPNKYDGMFAVTLDEDKRVIWTYNEGEGVWSRVGDNSGTTEPQDLQSVMENGAFADLPAIELDSTYQSFGYKFGTPLSDSSILADYRQLIVAEDKFLNGIDYRGFYHLSGNDTYVDKGEVTTLYHYGGEQHITFNESIAAGKDILHNKSIAINRAIGANLLEMELRIAEVDEEDALTKTGFLISKNFTFFTDDFSGKGIQYAEDYSENFTDRSLVDKEYVDNAIPTKTSDLTNDGDGVSPFITEAEADFIPLSGTEAGKPLTGEIEVDNSSNTFVGFYSDAGGAERRISMTDDGFNYILNKSTDHRSHFEQHAVYNAFETLDFTTNKYSRILQTSQNTTIATTDAYNNKAEIVVGDYGTVRFNSVIGEDFDGEVYYNAEEGFIVRDNISGFDVKLYPAGISGNTYNFWQIYKENTDSNASNLVLPDSGITPRRIPVSVNGNYADTTGNITVPIPDQVNLIEGSNITITGTYPNLTISASGTVGTDWEDIGGDQSTVNLSGFTNDAGFITEVTESDVTQYETALTITESQISDLGDYLESGDNISELVNDVGYLTEADLPPSELQDLQSVMGQGSSATFINPTEPLPEHVGFTFLGEDGTFVDYSGVTAGNFISNKQVSAIVDNGETEGQSIAALQSGMFDNSFTSEQILYLRTIRGAYVQESKLRQHISDSGASGFQLIHTSEDGNDVMGINSHTETGMVVRDDVLETGLKYASDYSENGETDDLWIPSWGAVKAYADSAIPTQDLDSVLDIGNTSERPIVLGDGVKKTITYSGESIVYDYKGKSITVEFESDGNYTHTLPNKNGTYAMLDDIPSLSGYATEAYVANYKRPVNRVSTGDVLSISLPESRFIFTGTSTQTFKVLSPSSGLDGVKIDFYNPTDYNVAVEVYTVGDEIMDLTSNSIVTSVIIGPKSGGEFFCDYNNDLWYYNKK